ncbi:MAG: hypothetical protein M0Q49_02390 [Porticoccaceae bacterium]|nr:hypothetical protein [Porticoccaceae bacterium]
MSARLALVPVERTTFAVDVARATLPQEHARAWHAFWAAKAVELGGYDLRVEVGDEWATVRDDAGRLVEQFVIATTRLDIEGRLTAALVDRLTTTPIRNT